MNAESEFQNKCVCTFKGHHPCTAAQLAVFQIIDVSYNVAGSRSESLTLTPVLFTKFNEKCSQLLVWVVTLPFRRAKSAHNNHSSHLALY